LKAVNNHQPEGNHLMKKMIFTLACCALIAPLGFGKDIKHVKAWHFAFISEPPITVTATTAGMRVEGAAAATYQPLTALVVQQDGPGRYVLEESGHVFNSKGEAVHGSIRPGTRMHVYFAKNNGIQTIERVVVD
jgi:hypothetical protein